MMNELDKSTKAWRQPRPFDGKHSTVDRKSADGDPPKEARWVFEGGFYGARFVPVSFVAADWKVTPRRIRALLAAGRLLGRVQDNGYWEVRWPYLFAFGTRGPSLRRQQKPVRRKE
jgi:hypothetical protein